MSRIVAIINQKGGVGKTTTTANLGAALSRSGKRVLTLDVDPQANLSSHLGFRNPSEVGKTMYDVLAKHASLQEVIKKVRHSTFDLACSDINLAGADIELGQEVGRELILKEKLAPISADYDWILMDCPPSLGVLSMNAAVAAKEILIPVQTEYFALEGMDRLLQFINVVKDRINHEVMVSWIVPCLVDSRRTIDREIVEHISKHFPNKITKSVIRRNVALADASAKGVDVFEYDPKSHGAQDYQNLAEEVCQ